MRRDGVRANGLHLDARLRLLASLRPLYGAFAESVAAELAPSEVAITSPGVAARWSERDIWLITYPDQFQDDAHAPLVTLRRVYNDHLRRVANGIHILPCYPWTSDDGYAITDYFEIEPAYGSWPDVEALAGDARVMLDAVLNHMSSSSTWFRRFLEGDPDYAGYFRTADPNDDLGGTVRPRTTPLLTEFSSATGAVWVWTTFSADQVDLDFRNPSVFVAVARVLMEYAERGAEMIRLDAVQFIGKEEGTESINLPMAHLVVQALRAALDTAHPGVLLITESNVPHAENLAYLGEDGEREAQAVYQFALAPLVLHTMVTGDTTALARWASDLPRPRAGTTYLNFLASHDGVAVRPVEGILKDSEIDRLVSHAKAAGGLVNSRSLRNGKTVPYELACTWFDLMAHGVGEDEAVRRHLASHAIMLALQGVPAFYVHSLFGTSNDYALANRTGMPRSLNRHRFGDVSTLEGDLMDQGSRAARVLAGVTQMADARRENRAFAPDVPQTLLATAPGVFGVQRGRAARVYVNISAISQTIDSPEWVTHDGRVVEHLGPYEVCWLRPG